MWFLIFLSLILYLLANRRFVSVLTYCARKVPIGPELSAPQFLPHLRTALEYLFGRYAFEHRHYLRHTLSRYRLHQKMHVVFVRANF